MPPLNVRVTSSGPGTKNIKAGLRALQGAEALVGIPEADNRGNSLTRQAMSLIQSGTDPKRAKKLIAAAKKSAIGNAALMFIHTNGSPLRGIPARPVIEPAIQQPNTKGMIAKQLAGAAKAALDGDQPLMVKYLDRAGTIGESASKAWFTDPANNWAPNAPSTIAQKGSDSPLIDRGELRRSITHVVEVNGTSQNGTP